MDFPSVHSQFAAQAARTPDAVAVTCGQDELTYRELNARANQLAHRLRRYGAGPETPVAVLMERSAHLVVALLAVLKTGGFYMPLHSAYPRERMQKIMDHAGRPVLLVDREAKQLPGARLLIEADAERAYAEMPGTDPVVPVSPDNTAYVMHTSGSTGEPVGVAVRHEGVLGMIEDSCWGDGGFDRVLAIAPPAFSVSVYELWVPLLRGGQVILAPPGEFDAHFLRQVVTEHRVTGLHLTAGLFRLLAEESPDCLNGVRQVLTGGDVISAAAVRRVMDACPGLVVRAMYGATELSVFVTTAPVARPESGDGIPLGRPMTGVELYVLDGNRDRVPDGAVGELYVGGRRLARGYFGRPDLTADRFVGNPFAGEGERMYRTGDLVRLTGDGQIDFVSRINDQIKIRGFRVEPLEVEHVLAARPGVAHVAVVAREAGSGDKHLVAYVVPEPSGVDIAELRAHAKAHLPDYMVPSAFVAVGALPLTPNGKIDRRALPEPTFDQAAAYEPAVNERQEMLCALFAEVLEVGRVGIDDSFFDLGGQSMLAARVAARIEKGTGVRTTVGDVLNAPTVRELDTWLAKSVPVATK
ncbi:non-ribosomal peptide synthetase [Kibdelosporangium phytohabitans]|uniref:Thioester reductase n=1 Tax=Kibdelosporangium phytohabitans TaxID=860235 RepID=A0A0N9I7L8_9PSEU|nr:non-ribosomal peptide synthetase [Kibdelosporangium phytohabitans]ALG10752.1 thioester reductase [Kibdelosporangium phytohabitans]MBE1461904.1 amino acid adenylation domain-containing protein [Kibdelosporangium phytohabitans]